MGKIEDFGGFVNQHKTQGHQGVNGPDGNAVDRELSKGGPKIIHLQCLLNALDDHGHSQARCATQCHHGQSLVVSF